MGSILHFLCKKFPKSKTSKVKRDDKDILEDNEKPIDFERIKVGKKIGGMEIETIYASSNTNKYIIYKPKSKNAVCYMTGGCKHDDQLTKISLNVAKVYSLLCLAWSKKKYLPLIAQAYMNCFNGKITESIKILEVVEDEIKSFRKIRSRLFYLLYCIVFVIINIVICLLLVNYKFVFIKNIQDKLILLFKLATFGSVGGFISVSINLKKLVFEPKEGIVNSIVSAYTRIFLSMLSAVVIYYAIKAKLVLNTAEQDMSMIYVFCTVAGFSERFILGILKKCEKDDIENSSNTNSSNNDETLPEETVSHTTSGAEDRVTTEKAGDQIINHGTGA